MSPRETATNPWLAAGDGRDLRGRAESYAATFDDLAARGEDVHGEAALVDALLGRPSTVLDAGCGTGRVGIRLAELGHGVTGVDIDPGMLSVARERAAGLTWVCRDLADLDRAAVGGPVDAVVAAGNVMPLLTPGREDAALAALAGSLARGGLLVAGFGLDAEHLPPSAPQRPRFCDLTGYDEVCAGAGLVLQHRWATWDREPFQGGGYAVSVHRLG